MPGAVLIPGSSIQLLKCPMDGFKQLQASLAPAAHLSLANATAKEALAYEPDLSLEEVACASSLLLSPLHESALQHTTPYRTSRPRIAR